MNEFRKKLRTSPGFARVAPFIIFLILTSAQDMLGGDLRYWLYFAKTAVGAWLIWELWPIVTEMRWSFSLEAVAVGIGIFVIWVGLDPYVPKNHLFFNPGGDPWNPNLRYGEGSAMAWFFVVVRIAGSSIVVPPLEEMFYRSFLYDISSARISRTCPEPPPRLVMGGDVAAFRIGALRVAGRHPVRPRLSVACPQQESARRRHDRACHHEFHPRHLHRVARGVGLLVMGEHKAVNTRRSTSSGIGS